MGDVAEHLFGGRKSRSWTATPPLSPPVTWPITTDLLERKINMLFPVVRDGPPPPTAPSDLSKDMEVMEGELYQAVGHLKVRNTAPGLDGIPGRDGLRRLS